MPRKIRYELVCAYCKKPGLKNGQKYCCRDCYVLDRTGKQRKFLKTEKRHKPPRTFICAHCGEEKEQRKGKKNKYCCQACYFASGTCGPVRLKLIVKECAYCHRDFKVKRKEKGRKYCSRSCSDHAKKGVIKVQKEVRICCICQKEFKCSWWRPTRVCSRTCDYVTRCGRQHTDETKAKMRASSKGAEVLARLRQDPEFEKKRIRAVVKSPNKPELLLGAILEELYPGEYKYTGIGGMSIDRLHPDFTNVNGKKKVIEMFGESFHDPNHPRFFGRGKNTSERVTEAGRRKVFAEHGYEMLVIWSKEIYRGGIEGRAKLIEKIKRYHEDRRD